MGSGELVLDQPALDVVGDVLVVALLEQEVAVREASSPCRDGLGGGAQAAARRCSTPGLPWCQELPPAQTFEM